MIGVRTSVLWLMLAATPAVAQTTQPAPAAPAAAAPQPAKPAAKPRKPHPTPVVAAPANIHAQRPAAAPPATAPAAAPPPGTAEAKGSVTGMKLPRWAALRADEVNLRVGPGTRFPIQWQYHRRDLPVEILREVDVWRLIEDQDGVKGWVHQATLIGHRGFVVKGADAVLRAAASETAPAVAVLKPGVVGRLQTCEAGATWCEVRVADYRGWLMRAQFWGSDPGEAVGE